MVVAAYQTPIRALYLKEVHDSWLFLGRPNRVFALRAEAGDVRGPRGWEDGDVLRLNFQPEGPCAKRYPTLP